jgi:hypothetical protein
MNPYLLNQHIERRISLGKGLSIFTLTVLFCVLWTGNAGLESRIVTIRYFLIVLSGLLAFIIPHIFFPDRLMPLYQLGNVSRKGIQKLLLKKFTRYSLPIYTAFPIMMFADLQAPVENLFIKLIYTLTAILFYTGIGYFSLSRYIKCGQESQFWKESEKGRTLRRKVADYLKYPLDPGAIPSLINTIWITILGIGSITLAAYAGFILSPVFELFTAIIISVLGLGLMLRTEKEIDRSFYSTNAFFREFFGETLSGDDVTEQRKVEQLWWVPKSIKAHVWQFILQQERILPAGRLIAAGHLAILFIAYQRPDETFITWLWVIFALLHHLLIALTFRTDVSPPWLHRWMGDKKAWFTARFWMQIRWVIPLLTGMNVQYFIFGTPNFYSQAYVIVTYLGAAVVISLTGQATLNRDFKST